MINPAVIFQLQNKWKKFTEHHPKLPMFLRAVSQTQFEAGTVIECNITTADGKQMCSNIKLSEEDIVLFHEISELMKQTK